MDLTNEDETMQTLTSRLVLAIFGCCCGVFLLSNNSVQLLCGLAVLCFAAVSWASALHMLNYSIEYIACGIILLY